MPNNLEHTTMYAVARLLWEDNVETWGAIPVDSPYHWDNLADSVRQKYYKRAVRIIDAAEPVWLRRIAEDTERSHGQNN
jgi:hypothetical protein